MRNILFSVFAIGVAAVAAMTATTAMLNTPVRPAPAVIAQNAQADPAAPPASDGKPATAEGAPPATPGGSPDAGAKPAGGAAAGASKDTVAADDEVDKDPYEGIAPEELPPDLQYSADSSVSFPTNI
jgi:hypothetical protein